jgi:hypothetical protein
MPGCGAVVDGREACGNSLIARGAMPVVRGRAVADALPATPRKLLGPVTTARRADGSHPRYAGCILLGMQRGKRSEADRLRLATRARARFDRQSERDATLREWFEPDRACATRHRPARVEPMATEALVRQVRHGRTR